MTTAGAPLELQRSATRRIAWRLLPFLITIYVLSFLDRTNVGFAALEMTRDLGFSDRVFGFGAGIFAVGYFVFEIPGALLVERWSARRWIAGILITWGLITVLMSAMHTPRQFYIARFLLGLAEAGCFPGLIVYLTHWFRHEDRAKAAAIFMTAIPLSSVVGSPLAGWVLGHHWLDLTGWRWLFVVEGVPAIIMGVLTLFYLTDWPREANWLPETERAWIGEQLRLESEARERTQHSTVWQALRKPDVIMLTLVYFLGCVGIYGFVIWFPTIVKRASGLPNMAVTLLSALPFVAGLGAMLWNGWHSDKKHERQWHTAVPLFLGAACLGAATLAGSNLFLGFAAMVVVGACTTAILPTFWALPTEMLTASAAAAAIGLINSVGNLGGFAGPYVIGYLRTATNSFTPGLLFVSASMFLGGVLVLTIKVRRN
jgi:ACS family tartrate transporter-like MFS transporter